MGTVRNSEIITTGHAGFALRHTWLKKACDCGDKAFLEDNATIMLGVGKNMVQSIRFYAKCCDIFDGEGKTRKDTVILVDILKNEENDPYLDYAETVWLIHHKLATNPKLISYYEFFNSFNETLFNNERYRDFLNQQIRDKEGIGRTPAEETIKRDVDCFISNYAVKMEEKPTDSFGALLRELNLIKTAEKSIHKRIYKKATDISDSIFLYVLSQFWHSNHPDDKTLSLQAISQDAESPGRIFQMHEDEIHKKLKSISQSKTKFASISETAGIVNMNIKVSSQEFAEKATQNLLKVYK